MKNWRRKIVFWCVFSKMVFFLNVWFVRIFFSKLYELYVFFQKKMYGFFSKKFWPPDSKTYYKKIYTEAEFKEFEPRLKYRWFKPALMWNWIFEDLSRGSHSVNTDTECLKTENKGSETRFKSDLRTFPISERFWCHFLSTCRDSDL